MVSKQGGSSFQISLDPSRNLKTRIKEILLEVLMEAERDMGAALGIRAEKSMCPSLSLALPASPSSPLGPGSVPDMAGGRPQV